jgi:hypothetical protein
MNGLAEVLVVIAGLVFVGALIGAYANTRSADQVSTAPVVSCAQAQQATGTVRLQGVAEPVPSPYGAPVAPLSGQPYAWCESRVSYDDWRRDSDGDQVSTTVTVDALPGGSFVVRDASGAVLVDGANLRWHDLPDTIRTTTRGLPPALRANEIDGASSTLSRIGLNEKWAERGARFLADHDNQTYHLFERTVAPGTPVVVLGELRRDPDGALVLGGGVLASTESPQEVESDQRAGARTALVVAAVAAAVAVAALVVGLIV